MNIFDIAISTIDITTCICHFPLIFEPFKINNIIIIFESFKINNRLHGLIGSFSDSCDELDLYAHLSKHCTLVNKHCTLLNKHCTSLRRVRSHDYITSAISCGSPHDVRGYASPPSVSYRTGIRRLPRRYLRITYAAGLRKSVSNL